ncbi:Neuropeptide Y receptor, partial [Orchesella cincta]
CQKDFGKCQRDCETSETERTNKLNKMEGVGAGGIMYSNFEFGSLEEDLDERAMSSSSRDVDRSLEANNNMTEEEMYRYYSQNESSYCSNLSACFNESFIDYIGEEEEMYSLGFKIAIAILYNSVFVTALLGNALVCYVVFSSPRMRTVTNYLIANLAVGDLLMAVFCVPFSYIPVLLQYWPFGKFMCYLLPPAQAVSVLVSSYTLVALAADRYIAILYPLRPRFRRSQACWVIAVVWLIAVITASPIAIFTEHYQYNSSGRYYCEETGWSNMGAEEFKLPYGLTLMILQYFFPLTVLIFTYSRIAVAVWGKKSLGEAEDSRDQRLAKTKRKTVAMSLAVVAGYTSAWLPLNLWVLVGHRINWYPQYVFFACHSLAMAHTTYNPVIYAWMNVRFRTAFLSVLSRLPCPCLLKFCLARNSDSNNQHMARGFISRESKSGQVFVSRYSLACSCTHRLEPSNLLLHELPISRRLQGGCEQRAVYVETGSLLSRGTTLQWTNDG